MDDNMYPTNSQYFGLSEPEDQVKDRAKDKSETLSVAPILQEIVDGFTERIAFYESIGSIPDSVLGDPELFMHTVAANKIAAANLQNEKARLESRLQAYSK